MSSIYNKAIIMAITVLLIFGAAIASSTQAGVNLGLSPMVLAWVQIFVGAGGTAFAVLTGNKNQPTIAPGQVVVPATSVKPEATNTIVAIHKP
jgi:hypothetical protein